ncbi:hypothetical protein [Halomarina rubra]|uniref:HTH domain-containing protein n=1 Tax=Halomarina rubra TaxID=2071873 RepID=A0ABD6AUH7_9EURY|nr:hypothetical protein [Halomarina rubra]
MSLDPSKPTEDYSPDERRKDLLDRVKEAGTPAALPAQARLAEQYGVSQPTISRDLSAISTWVAENIGDRHALTTYAAFERSLQGALDAEEWEAASRIAKRRADWIEGRNGHDAPVDDVPDHRDPNATLDYEIVTDDGDADAEADVAEAEQ